MSSEELNVDSGDSNLESVAEAAVSENPNPDLSPSVEGLGVPVSNAFQDVLGDSSASVDSPSLDTEALSDTPFVADYGFTKDLALQHVEFDSESPLMQSFQEVALDAGLGQEQIEKLVGGYLQALDESVGQAVQQFSQSSESLSQQTLDTLKEEWGVDAYAQKMPRVAQLLKSTFSEEALEVLRSSPDLGSSVALIKGFAEITERFGETAFVEGTFATTNDAYTYGSSEAFMSAHKAILMDPNHAEYGAYTQRYSDLVMSLNKLPVA